MKFLVFLFRAYQMDSAIRKSALGVHFTEKQVEILRHVWTDEVWSELLTPKTIWDEGEEDVDDEEDEDEDEDENGEDESDDEDVEDKSDDEDVEGGDDEEKIEDEVEEGEERQEEELEGDRPASINSEVDKLAELVFQLSIFFATEKFTDGEPYSSLLVYYSGALGCSEDGLTFRRATDFTGRLSGLIYVLRLLLLEYALPFRTYSYVGLDCRPRHSHLERLNEVRLEYMTYGCLTPLGEFQSLRSYGRKIAQTETPVFLVRWSDDGQRLYYHDTSFAMSEFSSFGHHLVKQGENLCKILMCDWLPEVDLNRVRDDLSNTRQGYSFIQHPTNDLTSAYLNLSTRACTAPDNCLLNDNGWDYEAVYRYLKQKERFLETLLAVMYTLGGQAPRSTELFSLECCNGPSTERGVYVYNGFMIYVTRHHKAKKSTNKEFNVARFLPTQAGKLLFYYLVYIRPFAEMLFREVCTYSVQNSSSFMFCSNKDPQKPWTSQRLTRVLREKSAEVLEKPIGIALYRQLSIAITEKHVKCLARPFNRHDDRSIEADTSVVFAWQSGHRPMQRGMTYGLDGAFPTRLQPALLRIYEWASVEWHQYLGYGSKAGCGVGRQIPVGHVTRQFVSDNESESEVHIVANERDEGYVVDQQPPLEVCSEHGSCYSPRAAARQKRKYVAMSPDDKVSSEKVSKPFARSRRHSSIHEKLLSQDQSQQSPEPLADSAAEPLTLMKQFRSTADMLAIVSEFRVAICKACREGVLPSQIWNHYGSKKHQLDVASRRQIRSEISQREDLIQNEEDLMRELTLPSPTRAPLSDLVLYRDGRACTFDECRYVCRTLQGIQKHCRVQHGWVNEQRRGGSLAMRMQAQTMVRPWRDSVHCQRFFTHGPRQEYFEVSQSL
jgi:hypothetical protein